MPAFRVLIADPDPLLLAACRVFLVGQDVDLTAVTTASAAQTCTQAEPLDLSIIDPELPGFRLDDFLPSEQPDGRRGQLILAVHPDQVQREWLCHPGVALLPRPASPALLALLISSFAQAAQACTVEAEC
jgi:hypothetical protein